MPEPVKPQSTSAPAGVPVRRASDALRPASDAPEAAEHEVWYRALRVGARPVAEIARIVPLDVIFAWHAQRRISEVEFAALMAAQDIQEVVISELAPTRSAEVDETRKHHAVLVSALRSRLAALDQVAVKDSVVEDDLRTVFDAAQPLPDGIGIVMRFASPVTPPEGSGPLPPPLTPLTIQCRAYVASAGIRSAVKCEAVFTSPALPGEFYCRIILPLPIVKGGRRRLFVAVLDNETRQPINLPPEVAELFQEKFILELKVLRKPAQESAGGLGDLVKGTFGRLLGR